MADKVYRITFELSDGTEKAVEFTAPQGNAGRGIASITRTSGTGAAGTVDTYTIRYTDSTTSTFQVRNGTNGTGSGTGVNGATFTPYVDTNGNLSWTNDKGLANPTTVNIMGPQGNSGRGISSIKRTSGTGAAGTIDTYTITYTDSTTSTFQVRNGTNGTGSGTGVNGATFTPNLDDNGNLSWANDKGLANPATVNIMGPQGIQGIPGYTPKKYVDYFTDEDQEEIVERAAEDLTGMFIPAVLTSEFYGDKLPGEDGEPYTHVAGRIFFKRVT